MTVQWRKSSHSGGANDATCVEVAGLPDAVGIRDSKAPDAAHLTVSATEFGTLLDKIKKDVLGR
ncbi:DUF397 domain-containing protein [Actinomadura adrarensis]|uniref:DUF397 domain-containing protein n=1 Tax=Actinomadura adrarensis TaxID=1819600 RepID=A0ABW3CRJ3_9ACTN